MLLDLMVQIMIVKRVISGAVTLLSQWVYCYFFFCYNFFQRILDVKRDVSDVQPDASDKNHRQDRLV